MTRYSLYLYPIGIKTKATPMLFVAYIDVYKRQAVGTDIDMATVQVQNRVSVAQSSLPEPVVVQGVTVQKQSSNIVMFLTMQAKDSVYDGLYLTNYAQLNLVDQLTRVPGVGAVNVMGAGNYSCLLYTSRCV